MHHDLRTLVPAKCCGCRRGRSDCRSAPLAPELSGRRKARFSRPRSRFGWQILRRGGSNPPRGSVHLPRRRTGKSPPVGGPLPITSPLPRERESNGGLCPMSLSLSVSLSFRHSCRKAIGETRQHTSDMFREALGSGNCSGAPPHSPRIGRRQSPELVGIYLSPPPKDLL